MILRSHKLIQDVKLELTHLAIVHGIKDDHGTHTQLCKWCKAGLLGQHVLKIESISKLETVPESVIRTLLVSMHYHPYL